MDHIELFREIELLNNVDETTNTTQLGDHYIKFIMIKVSTSILFLLTPFIIDFFKILFLFC